MIEKEALAVTWGCEKFRDFLLGKSFLIETDHKPLVLLLGCKDLDQLPLRVRFQIRLMRYTYDIVHVPGKQMYTADTLSRAPSSQATAADTDLEEETKSYVQSIMSTLPASDQRMEQIRLNTMEDDICRQIMSYCEDGWPEKHMIKGVMKAYYPYKSSLTVEEGIIMLGNRVFIPPSLRMEMLERLHTGHQGITKCCRLAQQSMWWPDMSTQIEEMSSVRAKCQE